jgi:secreted Zn-dependent insulinase-like peptidase
MLFRKKQDKNIAVKEKEIDAVKKEFNKNVDKDLERIHRINAVLSNGITLKVFNAVGGKHDR